MFTEQAKEIKAIVEACKQSLKDTYIGNVSFIDTVIKQSENSNGKVIKVTGKGLLKFLVPASSHSMVEYEYERNLKGSRKEYVTLKLKFHVEGVEISDIVNFVDFDDCDKFYSTDLNASKQVFQLVEALIQPLFHNTQQRLEL